MNFIQTAKRRSNKSADKHDSTDLFAFLLENSTGKAATVTKEEDRDDYFEDDLDDEEYHLDMEIGWPKKSTKSRSVNSAMNVLQPATTKPLSEEETRTIDLMQARMAQNVAGLGNRPLNTMEIAKQCKRIMVAYNIGQRLFAKAVMREVVKVRRH